MPAATPAFARHRIQYSAIRYFMASGNRSATRWRATIENGGHPMPATTARYTIISADTHAGGSHAQYREYLDESFREEFDAWRGKYKNPFKDLRDTSDRVRNWDSERRWSDMQRDGVFAEVISPNPIPPFFPSFVCSPRRPT